MPFEGSLPVWRLAALGAPPLERGQPMAGGARASGVEASCARMAAEGSGLERATPCRRARRRPVAGRNGSGPAGSGLASVRSARNRSSATGTALSAWRAATSAAPFSGTAPRLAVPSEAILAATSWAEATIGIASMAATSQTSATSRAGSPLDLVLPDPRVTAFRPFPPWRRPGASPPACIRLKCAPKNHRPGPKSNHEDSRPAQKKAPQNGTILRRERDSRSPKRHEAARRPANPNAAGFRGRLSRSRRFYAFDVLPAQTSLAKDCGSRSCSIVGWLRGGRVRTMAASARPTSFRSFRSGERSKVWRSR